MTNTVNKGYKLPANNDSGDVIADLASNFTKIDTDVKANETALDTHKNNASAHSSENITHANGSVKTILDNHETRITQTTSDMNTLVYPALTDHANRITAIEINGSGGGGGGSTAPNEKHLNDYISFKAGTDWAPAFNQAFADLTAIGGGVLRLAVGTYTINSMLTIPTNINVIGGGVGATVIRLANGVDSNIINFDTNDNCGISFLTVQGNLWDANPMTNKTGVIIGRTGLDLTNGNMSNLNIHDIYIRDIGGDGLRSYTNTWVYSLSRIRIEFCSGHGAYVQSTDNTYTDFYINGIGKKGLYVTGSNNRFSDMKIIFCGRGNDTGGGTFIGSGDDFDSGVYDTGKRNQYANVEVQENYGHGFVLDGAMDTSLMGILSDANGYAMIPRAIAATAAGFYFKGAQRVTGDIRATIFKSTISQLRGYYIDAGCSNISLTFTNDHDQAEVNLSSTAIVRTPVADAATQAAVNYTSNKQYTDFLSSNTTLTNAIGAYNGTHFQLGTDKVTSYTVNGNEFQTVLTNWAGSAARLGTAFKPVVSGRTYLVRLLVKPTVNNYFLRVQGFYDEGPNYDTVKRTDARYVSSGYTDVSFTFTADRNSSNFILSVWDNIDGNNATQGTFNVKDVAIIDITDALAQYYLVATLDKAVKQNYFVGAYTFTGTPTTPAIETAWEAWTPSLIWSGGVPSTITTNARRKISGKTVWFSLVISAADGNGATGVSIGVPTGMKPKQNNLLTPFYNTVIIGSSTNVNRQVNLRDDANQDINFGYLGTATAGQTLKIYFQGFYELA